MALQPSDARELTAKAAEAARLLTLLANRRRLAILCQLVGGERSVGALVKAVGLTQSALSQHLAKLRCAGIVATRRDAQTVFYRLASAAAGSVMKTLADIYCGGSPRKAPRGSEEENSDQIDGHSDPEEAARRSPGAANRRAFNHMSIRAGTRRSSNEMKARQT